MNTGTAHHLKLNHIGSVIACLCTFAALGYPMLRTQDDSATHVADQTKGVLLYTADYDDYLPLGTAWNTGKDQMCMSKYCFATWAYTVTPYMTSYTSFHDPNAPANPPQTKQMEYDTFHTQYGYNYSFLSPNKLLSTGLHVQGVSKSAATSAAQTVMIASKWASSKLSTSMVWSTGIPEGMLADAGVEPPNCLVIPGYCMSGWGAHSFFDHTGDPNGMQLEETEGRYTGGVAFRDNGKVVVGWLDGHVSSLTPAELAVGTNWAPSIEATAVTVTDAPHYLWSLAK